MTENLKLNKESIQKFWDALIKYDNIILCLHENSDPDSLCSNAAMMDALIEIGKSVTFISGKDTVFSKKMHSLPWLEKVTISRFEDLDFGNPKTCFIMIDIADESRVHGMGDNMTLPKIVIDHHKSNNITGAEFAIVDTDFSSAAQMVYEIVSTHTSVTKNFLQAVYMGMYSDTGGFKFGISSRVFEIASIVFKSADMNPLVQNYTKSLGADDLAILAIATNSKKYFSVSNINFCVVTLSRADIQRHPEITEASSMNIVTTVFSDLQDADVVFIARQGDEDDWRVSVRSFLPGGHARQIAEYLGGGGHDRAAGIKMYNTEPRGIVATVQQVVDSLYK